MLVEDPELHFRVSPSRDLVADELSGLHSTTYSFFEEGLKLADSAEKTSAKGRKECARDASNSRPPWATLAYLAPNLQREKIPISSGRAHRSARSLGFSSDMTKLKSEAPFKVAFSIC